MINGKILYKDFFEVNMPFIIYFTQISVLLSKLLNVNLVTGLNIFNFSCALIILIMCYKIVALQTDYKKRLILPIFITYAALIVPLTFPTTEFGQKEHIFMLFALPYLVNFILKGKISKLQVLLLCFGLMIKPFFLVIYIAVTIIRILHKENYLSEFLFIAFSQISYYAALKLMHPEYFNTIIPIALESYVHLNITDETLSSRLYYFYILSLFTIFNYILPIIISSFVPNPSANKLLPLLAATLLIVLMQNKFFWYHYIPFITIAILYFGFIFINETLLNNLQKFLKTVILVLILGCMIGNFSQTYEMYNNQNNIIKNIFPQMFELLSRYKSEKVLLLSPFMSPTFPIESYLNFEWDMRQHSMQILEGLFKYPDKIDYNGKTMNYVVNDVTQALKQMPKVVIVLRPQLDHLSNKWLMLFFFKAGQDYISFFSKNNDFKLLWKNYSLKSQIINYYASYDIFERNN